MGLIYVNELSKLQLPILDTVNNTTDQNQNVAETGSAREMGAKLRSLTPAVLAEIFNHLPLATVVANPQRQMLYVNPAMEQLFGHSSDHLLGQTTQLLYAKPEDYQTQGAQRFNPTSDKPMEDYRVDYRRADDSIFLGLTTAGAIHSESGDTLGYIAFIQVAGSEDRSLATLQKLHAITANTELEYSERIDAMLQLGIDHFGLELAIQSRIKGREYLVEHCVDRNDNLEPGTVFDVKGTYCIHVLNAGQPIGFHYAGQSEIQNHPCYLDFGLEAYIGGTIFLDGEVYGTLNFSSSSSCAPFTRDDLVFIQLIADNVGSQIAQEKLNKRLLDLANTDELTGLSRRGSIMESLEWHLSHVQRTGEPLSLIAADLDYFKKINDTWGHATGDRVLQRFAIVARGVVRGIDLCGRIGGEEFLFVLPDTDPEGGRVVAERLRKRLAAEEIEAQPGMFISVTASAGVATYKTGETMAQFLARADRALYNAKGAGRDQVHLDEG